MRVGLSGSEKTRCCRVDDVDVDTLLLMFVGTHDREPAFTAQDTVSLLQSFHSLVSCRGQPRQSGRTPLPHHFLLPFAHPFFLLCQSFAVHSRCSFVLLANTEVIRFSFFFSVSSLATIRFALHHSVTP